MRRQYFMAQMVALVVTGVWSLSVPALAQDRPELVGHIPGSIKSVAAAGDSAYVVNGGNLGVIDLSTPSAPVAAGAAVGSIHDDLILDVGRGPVTVHVPPNYDPSDPAPLVVLLHGSGDTGQNLEGFFRFLPWSDRLGFLYVFPDAPEDQGRAWNATDACPGGSGNPGDDSCYLRALIDGIISELSVDTGRIYLLGFSSGGFMVYRMACDHADIVTAVVSLAGAMYLDTFDCTPSAPVRTLEIHGTADNSVPYEGTSVWTGAVATTELWAAYNQCSMVPDLNPPPLNLDTGLPGFETTVARYADGCAAGSSAELWTTVDAGHMPCLSSDFTPLVLDFFGFPGVLDGLLSHRHFIPAAAYAAGTQGAFFQTDVDVTNTGDSAARYRFRWLARGQNNFESMVSEEFVLDAGTAARYTNAVHEIFGLEPDALGAIEIEASSPDLLFMSRTYTLDQAGSGGSFGQAMPAIAEHDMIPGGERRRILFASEDEQYRTNVACQNACPLSNLIRIELFTADGNSLERKLINLESLGNDQLNRVFEEYSPVNGYADVWAPLLGRAIYCYGSVLDNLTSDPTTILPQAPSDDVTFIPAAALAAGAEGSFFQTDLDLNNVGSTDLTYELLWLPRGADNTDPVSSGTFSLAAGTSVRYTNVLAEVFGLEPNQVGALAIEASGTDLLAMSRTYNLLAEDNPLGFPAGATFGQELSGIPANQMIPTGEKKRIIFMSETEGFRANVGCVNGVGTEVAVQIELYDSDGVKLETTYMMLPPYSNRQINGIFQDYAPVNGYVDVRTFTPDAAIYCYGSVLDNLTSDPTTVLPQ